MVFRNGGVLRKNEKWWFKNEKIDVVSYYKYLGVSFSSRLSWSTTTRNLAAQALKVVALIKLYNKKCSGLDIKTSFFLFDRMVAPILYYGAEIWGIQYINSIEKVHTRFCKYILKVGNHCSDIAALGECGRFPLFVYYHAHAIKYWVKLMLMSDTRLPKQCYKMLVQLDEAGRTKFNWVTMIKNSLFKYGFGYAWISQEVGDVNIFMSNILQRLKDNAYQEWHDSVDNSPKLDTYKTFKSLLDTELYLLCVPNTFYKKSLAQLRCSNHNLQIEKARHQPEHTERNKRFCNFCEKNGLQLIEDEQHFVLGCPAYSQLRDDLIPLSFRKDNKTTFINLMKSQDKSILFNLSKYVFNAFKLRSHFVSM